jgi:hypothetical protein
MDISRMTSEQIAQTPELAHLYDIVRFLEVTPEKDVFPKKYETATISMAVQSAKSKSLFDSKRYSYTGFKWL